MYKLHAISVFWSVWLRDLIPIVDRHSSEREHGALWFVGESLKMILKPFKTHPKHDIKIK